MLFRSGFQVDKFDFVFVDEAQDMNKMQLALVKKMFDVKNGGRLVAVGDPCQAIFGFAGSDENSFNNIADIPNTVRLPLSVSYRCAKNIIKYVRNKTNVGIDFWENAKDGVVNEESSVNMIKDGDMVICRNTAPLIALCMKFISEKKAAYIRGKDVGDVLANQIKRFVPTKLMNNENGFDHLYQKLDNEIEKARRKAINKGLTPEQAEGSSGVVLLTERRSCFVALQDDSQNPQDMVDNINKIFSKSDRGGIQLTTAHRSKGLEAKIVHIIEDDLLHGMRAKNEFQKIQENNLRYVAYTRAKDELNFVTDWSFSDKPNKRKKRGVKKGFVEPYIGNESLIEDDLEKSFILDELNTICKGMLFIDDLEKGFDPNKSWEYRKKVSKNGITYQQKYNVKMKEEVKDSFEDRKKEFERSALYAGLKDQLVHSHKYNGEFFDNQGKRIHIPERFKDVIDKEYHAKKYQGVKEIYADSKNALNVEQRKHNAEWLKNHGESEKHFTRGLKQDKLEHSKLYNLENSKRNVAQAFDDINQKSTLSQVMSAFNVVRAYIDEDINPLVKFKYEGSEHATDLAHMFQRMEKVSKETPNVANKPFNISDIHIVDLDEYDDEDFHVSEHKIKSQQHLEKIYTKGQKLTEKETAKSQETEKKEYPILAKIKTMSKSDLMKFIRVINESKTKNDSDVEKKKARIKLIKEILQGKQS